MAFKRHLTLHNSIIFITGGVVLSLELLSSRILNPYFGVSLYIWTGILSITLIALSIGYHRGGVISDVNDGEGAPVRAELEYRFLLLPAESSIALAIVCALYPWVFYDLARINLVFGAFVASAFLLLVPLVSLSSMNPILIAMSSSSKGDGGAGRSAGRVFFISTIGSVAGVLVTAFLFIPNMTNYSSVLSLGVLLSLMSLAVGFKSDALTAGKRKKVVAVSATGLVLCGVLLAFSSTYLKKSEAVAFGERSWKIEKEYASVFGNIKVVKIDGKETVYYQGGHRQSHIDERGRSVVAYTYGMEALVTGARPKPRSALVLGLAGGVIPMALAREGLQVEVVEIIPEALDVAREFFRFDDKSVKVYLADARTFVKECSKGYDAVLVDLFHGDTVPEYVVTSEFYRDIKGCLEPGGLVVLNTVVPHGRFMGEYYHILRTLKSVYGTVEIFFDEKELSDDRPFTVYVVAKDGKTDLDVTLEDVPEPLRESLTAQLKSPQPLDKAMLDKAAVLTDEHNFYPFLNAGVHLAYHKAVLIAKPRFFLVN